MNSAPPLSPGPSGLRPRSREKEKEEEKEEEEKGEQEKEEEKEEEEEKGDMRGVSSIIELPGVRLQTPGNQHLQSFSFNKRTLFIPQTSQTSLHCFSPYSKVSNWET